MAVDSERLAHADRQIALWRRRTVLVVLAMAVVMIGGVWLLFHGSAGGAYEPLLEHGSVMGTAQCGPKVPSREVDDAFGGGGRILDYVDGARCEAVISITNATDVPVTVLSVEKTPRDRVEPIRLIGATRDPEPMSAKQDCLGCSDDFEPFTPMAIAPGDEWEIAVQGVMRNCRPVKRAEGSFTTQSRDTLEFAVEADGERRPVTIDLENPWAVRHGGCSTRF